MSEDGANQVSDLSTTSAVVARVSIEGAGIAIERPVDEEVMSRIIALLFGVSSAPLGIRGSGDSSPREKFRKQSDSAEQAPVVSVDGLTLGEFIVEVAAKTFSQKICAAGYYLIRAQGVESFSRDGVKFALSNAHEDMPGNFARDWSTAAAGNLIAAKQGEPGQFYVPTTGRAAVESRFQDAPKRRSTKRATRRTGSGPSSGGS
ncbi:MAG: hypothetical protein M3548_19935 [Actinomycetota bacterium]|nr:hypothetical protein [Actinomycetota bacterium]